MDEDWTSVTSTEEDQILKIIYRDDKDEFASFLKSSVLVKSGDLVKLKFGESELCLHKLLEWICFFKAAHCGNALLKGKDDLMVDLNIPNSLGVLPLHQAADVLSVGLVELFLSHGAQADVKCEGVNLKQKGLLPLHIALERVSSDENLNKWTPKDSIFKLIIILSLPQMKEALETNRLLAWKTKETAEVICYLVKEGKLIQLATLLMVAREKALAPMTFDSEEDSTSKRTMTFRQCINNELASLIDLEYSLMGRKEAKELFRLCKEKKLVMMHILQLVEIFERAGDAIEGYLQTIQADAPNQQVAHDLARLLSDVGLTLRSKDTDLSDLRDSWPTKLLDDPKQEEEEEPDYCPNVEEPTARGFQRRSIRMPPNLQSNRFIATDKPICGMHIELPRFVSARSSRDPLVLSAPVHQFHAFWAPKASFSSGCLSATELQVKDRTKVVEQYVRKYSASKQLASFTLAIKRGMRHMML